MLLAIIAIIVISILVFFCWRNGVECGGGESNTQTDVYKETQYSGISKLTLSSLSAL